MKAVDIRIAKDGKIYAKGKEVGEWWAVASRLGAKTLGYKYSLWPSNLKGRQHGDVMYKASLRYAVAASLYDEPCS